MEWDKQCGVIIPCLNEGDTIGPLVVEARKYVRTVVVVDDGSTDRTSDFAARAGAVVIRNCQSVGKGGALGQAMHWLAERGFEWALCLDGDGQHLPQDIPAFFSAAERTSACLIIGNRMSQSNGMPLTRRLVNHFMSWFLSRWSGQPLPDSQCGFRLVKVPVWISLNFRTRHFEIESESLIGFIAANRAVEFVPIHSIYGRERSKIRPVVDCFRWCRWLCRALGRKSRGLDQPSISLAHRIRIPDH